MYVQQLFEEQRREALDAFIARYPLGAIVTTRDSGVEVDHIPFRLHPEVNPGSECRTLRGHVARGNPLWKEIANEKEVLVVFQSPNAYISPAWMPGLKRHGKVAPSWNYAAVHAYGTAQVIEDAAWLKQHLHDLAESQEANRPEPWSLDHAPADFVASLLNYIVGIEIKVSRTVGKWFVGQQRSPSDRAGVVAGLLEENTDAATTIAEMMKSYAPPPVKLG